MIKLHTFLNSIKLISLIFISAGFFGVSISTLMETSIVEQPVEKITDFENITMCAPISRLEGRSQLSIETARKLITKR